jgi:CheY-like chemotaxis protein
VKYQVLLLEDEPALLQGLSRGLSKLPSLEVLTAGRNQEAALILQKSLPDLLIADLNLPDGSGLETIATYRERVPGGPLIVVTAHQAQYAEHLNMHPDISVLEKPVSLTDLRRTIAEKLFQSDHGTSPGPFHVQDFLQLASLGRHSLRLKFEMENGMVAHCDVVEGELWSVQYGEDEGVNALYRFLDLPVFSISYQSLTRIPASHNIQTPLQGLLLEYARQKDEAKLQQTTANYPAPPVVQEQLGWDLEKGPFNRYCLRLLKSWQDLHFAALLDLDQGALIGLAHKFPFLTRDLINKGMAVVQEALRGPRIQKFEKLFGEYHGKPVHHAVSDVRYQAGAFLIRASLLADSSKVFVVVIRSDTGEDSSRLFPNWHMILAELQQMLSGALGGSLESLKELSS